MAYYSPLRYPGGKGRLSPFMRRLIEHNGLCDGVYVEPFAGGAGVALALLFSEHVSTVVINDINRSIHAFWLSVLSHTDELCSMIDRTPVTMEEWHKQRDVQANPDAVSPVELGFSAFFLNRTNRSGIISGGVIGGKQQSGKWGIDARFNRSDLIARIRRISRYRNRVNLYNMDASALIADVLPRLPVDKTLVYLDPPYYRKSEGLYEHRYVSNDHEALSRQIAGIKQKWLVTYDEAPEIVRLYSEYRYFQYKLSYSTAARYQGSEIMIFGPNTEPPDGRVLSVVR